MEIKSTETEIQKAESSTIEIQEQCIDVVNGIQKKTEKLESPLSSDQCCIYRVPDYLRKSKEEHYTPQVISIGPFHHDAYNVKLKTMEQRKLRYLKYFTRRVEGLQISLEKLVSTIKEYEESIRRCYAETIQLKSGPFVDIILVDAIFILELFWRYHFNDWASEDNGASLEPWLTTAIRFDLILLENQLPFFILEKLFDLAFASHKDYDKSLLTVMAYDYFHFYNTQCISSSPHLKMKHFLDLLRTFWLPLERLPKRDNHDDEVVKHVYSATQLHDAGLKFRKGLSNCLFDINFKKGVLKMPPITLDNSSETLYRNLLALEQCHYSDKAYITDYFILLGFLITTDNDVKLLVRKGVMENLLGNDDEARDLVKKLCTNIVYVNLNSDYHVFCQELKAFYKKPWNRWQATLRRDYLSTPWRIVSTIAAVIFLLLTFLQTIYTMFPIKGSNRVC
ncbi:UPF0481 protein At3g47200-like [Quercus lobata]|uniref:Uncharacterized protein n=1 Tax=Quercus lobata TaxID=97700 RepID=A0A7N2R0G8_QUELO|nr:UPF0481 protein At3g47200-like [Quercus lobata]